VRKVRTLIYIRFQSRVELAGLYSAVRGNARLGGGHVTARAVIINTLNKGNSKRINKKDKEERRNRKRKGNK
jgi:hypothetical protein